MPLALNTSHPLYANIIAFVCVDDDNSVKDLKGDTCTTDAAVVIGSGTYGRHFRTSVVSNVAKGVALTAGHLTKPIANPAGTMIAVINAGNSRVNRGTVVDSPVTFSNSIGVYTNDAAGCQTGQSFPVALGTTDVIGTGAHLLAAAWNGTTEYKTYVDGNQEAVVSGSLGNANDNASSRVKYIGGATSGGYGGFAADYVYYIFFNKYLTESELDEIWLSLGSNNQISLLQSVAAPVSFSGTVPTQNAVVGTAFSVNLSSYFSGTQTPFTYAITAGALPAGLSLSGSTISGAPTAAGTTTGVVITATDTGSNTASTNAFNIVVNSALQPPQGAVTLSTATGVTSSGASVAYSYSASDQSGFEYRLNAGAAQSTSANPLILTGLTASTNYTVEIRAINAAGSGAWSNSVSFTTSAVPQVPQGTFTIGTITTTTTTASVPYTYSASDQTSIQYRLNGGSAVNATASPQSLTGLTANTGYTIEFRAVNATGNGSWSTASSFTTQPIVSVDGTITSESLKRNNGTLLANTSLTYIAIYDATTGALVVRKTGVSTNASGVFTFTDPALTAGNTYKLDWEASTGERRMPSKAAT